MSEANFDERITSRVKNDRRRAPAADNRDNAFRTAISLPEARHRGPPARRGALAEIPGKEIPKGAALPVF